MEKIEPSRSHNLTTRQMAFLTSATFVLDGSQIFDCCGSTLLPLTDLQRTSSFVRLSLLYNKQVRQKWLRLTRDQLDLTDMTSDVNTANRKSSVMG